MTVLTIPVNYDGEIRKIDSAYTKYATGYLIYVGMDTINGIKYRDYLRFSLANLPAGLTVAAISQVRLYICCYVAGDPLHLLDIHAYDTNGQTDPSVDTGATLYDRCASGNLYIDNSTAFRTSGDKWFVLGGNVKQDIIDAKAAVNRISLALHEEGDDVLYATWFGLEWGSGYSLLEITYEAVVAAKKPLMDGFVFVD